MIWLDRIYALEQGFPPAEDAVLGQLTVNSGVRGGQIELKGWVRRADDIARLQSSIDAHVGKWSAKTDKPDRAVSPYGHYFEASILPGSVSGTGQPLADRAPLAKGTGQPLADRAPNALEKGAKP